MNMIKKYWLILILKNKRWNSNARSKFLKNCSTELLITSKISKLQNWRILKNLKIFQMNRNTSGSKLWSTVLIIKKSAAMVLMRCLKMNLFSSEIQGDNLNLSIENPVKSLSIRKLTTWELSCKTKFIDFKQLGQFQTMMRSR